MAAVAPSRRSPRWMERFDFAQLSLVMQELKRRMPEKQDITVLLAAETDYQTLVTIMDTGPILPDRAESRGGQRRAVSGDLAR